MRFARARNGAVPVPRFPGLVAGRRCSTGCLGVPDLDPPAVDRAQSARNAPRRSRRCGRRRRPATQMPFPDAFQSEQTARLAVRDEPRSLGGVQAIEAELAQIADRRATIDRSERDRRARRSAPGNCAGWRWRRRPTNCASSFARRRIAKEMHEHQGAVRNVMDDFYRVRRLPPYVFEEVNRLKAGARAGGADIIDLGMGNPDLPTPPHILEKLVETVVEAAHQPLFRLARHCRAQARAGRLLRPPLRREAQPRPRGRRHARLEGRLRQHGAGDHRAGRHRAGAEPELSDPRLRLPDGRRRHPPRAGGAGAGILRRARARGAPLDPEADRGHPLLSGQPDGVGRDARFLSRRGRLREARTASSSSPTSPMPRSISTTATRRLRSCRCRARPR